MPTPKKTRYVPAEQEPDYPQAPDEAGTDAPPTAYDPATDGEPRCAVCGELLAWHEAECAAQPAALPPSPTPATLTAAAGLPYAYGVGHRVQPTHEAAPRTIIWRGLVRARHPETGLVHRVPVYRLDSGFWDCYYEDDLLAA